MQGTLGFNLRVWQQSGVLVHVPNYQAQLLKDNCNEDLGAVMRLGGDGPTSVCQSIFLDSRMLTSLGKIMGGMIKTKKRSDFTKDLSVLPEWRGQIMLVRFYGLLV